MLPGCDLRTADTRWRAFLSATCVTVHELSTNTSGLMSNSPSTSKPLAMNSAAIVMLSAVFSLQPCVSIVTVGISNTIL